MIKSKGPISLQLFFHPIPSQENSKVMTAGSLAFLPCASLPHHPPPPHSPQPFILPIPAPSSILLRTLPSTSLAKGRLSHCPAGVIVLTGGISGKDKETAS